MKNMCLSLKICLLAAFFVSEVLPGQSCSSEWQIDEIEEPAVVNPEYKPGWTLVFQDEFSGMSLNESLWEDKYGYIDSKRFFMERENIEVKNGICNLKTKRIDDYRTDPDGHTGFYPSTGSWIATRKRFGPNTFWEIRSKRNKIGYKSSFWAWDFSNNPADQVSVFDNSFEAESELREVDFEFNSNDSPETHAVSLVKISPNLPTQDNEWYTFAYDYGEGNHKGYINNQLAVNSYEELTYDSMTINLWTTSIYWRQEHYDNLNLDYEGEFKIDYVRIYEPNAEVEQPVKDFGFEQKWSNQEEMPRFIGDFNGDGKEDLIGFGDENTVLSLSISGSDYSSFTSADAVINSFSIAQGWINQEERPRLIGDVDGDGKDDIVGFGWNQLQVAISNSNNENASFRTPEWLNSDFNVENGYVNLNRNPRLLGDINGDGKDDIVGFSDDGTYVSISKYSQTPFTTGFYPSVKAIDNFGAISDGWENQSKFPRYLADVNGDGLDDIVGFGKTGVYVAISYSTLTTPLFRPIVKVSDYFDYNSGFLNNDTHPRYMADVNGDGLDDIVGFGETGVYASISSPVPDLSRPNEHRFFDYIRVLDYFSVSSGYMNNSEHPRFVKDINNDGKADIIGFGTSGVYAAISKTNGFTGSFENQNLIFNDFTSCNGWNDQFSYPRFIGDINADGYNDLVGFGYSHVHTFVGFNPDTYDPTKLPPVKDPTGGLGGILDGFVGSDNVDIYPNPMTEILNLKSEVKVSEIKISNLYGVPVLLEDVNSKTGYFDVSNLKKGLYNAKVFLENGVVVNKKLKK